MKKKCILFLIINLLVSLVSAENFTYSKIDGNFSSDTKIPFRYSIYNALDNDSSSSYATERKNDKKEEFLFRIETHKKKMFVDGIYIKNGYGDSKFYKENYRIKKLKICFGNAEIGNNAEYVVISLKDTNEEQYYKFDKSYEIKTYTCFYAIDLFPTEKYNDICITDINFSMNKEKLENLYHNPSTNICYDEFQYTDNKISSVKIKSEYLSEEVFVSSNDSIVVKNPNFLLVERSVSKTDGMITEKYVKAIVTHYFTENRISKTRVKTKDDEFEFNYYYINGKLKCSDFGDFVYKDNKLVGFINYENSGFDLCPSFELKYDENDKIIKIVFDSAIQPGRDGWMATWCDLRY